MVVHENRPQGESPLLGQLVSLGTVPGDLDVLGFCDQACGLFLRFDPSVCGHRRSIFGMVVSVLTALPV